MLGASEMMQKFLLVKKKHYSDFDENNRHHKSCCSGDLAPAICAHLVDGVIDVSVLVEKCVAFVSQLLCVNICICWC